jgi:hypothetical protein
MTKILNGAMVPGRTLAATLLLVRGWHDLHHVHHLCECKFRHKGHMNVASAFQHFYVKLDPAPPRAPTAPPRAAYTTTTTVPIHRRVVYMRGKSKIATKNVTVLCRCPFGRNLFQHTTVRHAQIVSSLSQLGCPSDHGTLISGKTHIVNR